MKELFLNILSVGVDENASPLQQQSKKLFNFDCLLAMFLPLVVNLFYLFNKFFISYCFISLICASVAIGCLYLHYLGNYKKAVFITQLYYLGMICITTFLIQSPYFSLFLIPISISFFIYFVDNEKNTLTYFIIYILIGLSLSVLCSKIYITNSSFENHEVQSFRIILFCVLFLYKIIALVLMYRKTIDINLKNKKHLTLSEKRYRTQFENNLLGMIVLDGEAEVLDVNPAFCQMIGYTKDEIIKEKILTYCLQENSLFHEKLEQLKVKNINQFTYDKTFQRKDGHPLHTVVFIAGTYDENGIFINTNCSILDVTEKKAQEEMIQKTLDELNTKNADLKKYIKSNNQLENFAYMASHDLKAPLRTITSYSQLLVRRANGKLDETELEFFDFIINASKNMGNLIESLLVFSKVNSQNKSFEILNVNTLLDTVIKELKADIDEKDVNIHIDNLPHELVGDNSRLKQLFQNLISNAIKFMEKDKTPTIHIKCIDKKDAFLFSIEDNGIGIKPEFHDRIFNLFQKLHNSNEFEGTGIGLALCKEVVNQHKGEIWVESTYGEGTTFFFSVNKTLKADSKENALELDHAIAN